MVENKCWQLMKAVADDILLMFWKLIIHLFNKINTICELLNQSLQTLYDKFRR